MEDSRGACEDLEMGVEPNVNCIRKMLEILSIRSKSHPDAIHLGKHPMLWSIETL